jgi:hypothetical protein
VFEVGLKVYETAGKDFLVVKVFHFH